MTQPPVCDNPMQEAQYFRITNLVEKTVQRLEREGHSAADAKRMVNVVMSAEITAAMTKRQSFDEDRFMERLNQLPN